MIRFGRWQEILDEPLPEDRKLYCCTTAAMLQERMIAFANLGRHEEAAGERERAVEARKAIRRSASAKLPMCY